jgi:hypothetical protein
MESTSQPATIIDGVVHAKERRAALRRRTRNKEWQLLWFGWWRWLAL